MVQIVTFVLTTRSEKKYSQIDYFVVLGGKACLPYCTLFLHFSQGRFVVDPSTC